MSAVEPTVPSFIHYSMQYFGGHVNIKDHRSPHIGYQMIFQVLKEVTVTAWRESANVGAVLPDQNITVLFMVVKSKCVRGDHNLSLPFGKS
jgi:hypothetical protein